MKFGARFNKTYPQNDVLGVILRDGSDVIGPLSSMDLLAHLAGIPKIHPIMGHCLHKRLTRYFAMLLLLSN